MVRSGGGEGVSHVLLREVLAEAGIPAFPGAAELLAVHANEMLRWNRSIRLTAITDPVAVAVKHVADSLLLLRFGPFPGRILDFGSGAGYPGIPLAMYLPGTRVTLLEASVKKCAFLSRARGMLRLSNVDVVQARAEEGGKSPPTCCGRSSQRRGSRPTPGRLRCLRSTPTRCSGGTGRSA